MKRLPLLTIGVLVLAACQDATQPIGVDPPLAPVFQLVVNPTVTNGDFEAGDLSLGWTTNGTQNFSVTRVDIAGNHIATLAVGEGPTGDASCTNPFFANFAASAGPGMLSTFA